MATAATYGCFAGVRLLNVVEDLISFDGDLAGSGFWEFLAQEFPSVSTPFDDKKPQSAMNGLDALMSVLLPGIVTIPSLMINSTSFNPGSLLTQDRTADSNSYLIFLSMGLLGSLESRYGLPTSNYHKSIDLPWATAENTVGDGCAFASGLLNLYDGLTYVGNNSAPSVAEIYQTIASFLSDGLDASCTIGCQTCAALGASVSCTSCPTTLKNRDSCTGAITDVNSCAAAGIVMFVNATWSGPP